MVFVTRKSFDLGHYKALPATNQLDIKKVDPWTPKYIELINCQHMTITNHNCS